MACIRARHAPAAGNGAVGRLDGLEDALVESLGHEKLPPIGGSWGVCMQPLVSGLCHPSTSSPPSQQTQTLAPARDRRTPPRGPPRCPRCAAPRRAACPAATRRRRRSPAPPCRRGCVGGGGGEWLGISRGAMEWIGQARRQGRRLHPPFRRIHRPARAPEHAPAHVLDEQAEAHEAQRARLPVLAAPRRGAVPPAV